MNYPSYGSVGDLRNSPSDGECGREIEDYLGCQT
jgi:hypothetical protein